MKKINLFVFVPVFLLSLIISLYAQAPNEGSLLFGLDRYNLGYPHAEKEVTLFSSPFFKTPESINEPYLDSPADKMGTGVINATTSWAELPKEVTRASEDGNILAGLTVGFGRGMVLGFARGISGVYDMATCGLPPYDEPAMKPAYKVIDSRKEFRINLLSW